jgi:hypothetical protein
LTVRQPPVIVKAFGGALPKLLTRFHDGGGGVAPAGTFRRVQRRFRRSAFHSNTSKTEKASDLSVKTLDLSRKRLNVSRLSDSNRWKPFLAVNLEFHGQ